MKMGNDIPTQITYEINVSDKTLSGNLKELEADRLIIRKVLFYLVFLECCNEFIRENTTSTTTASATA